MHCPEDREDTSFSKWRQEAELNLLWKGRMEGRTRPEDGEWKAEPGRKMENGRLDQAGRWGLLSLRGDT